MESFLVMKNNLHRRFTKSSTYLVMILIPVIIAVILSITNRIQTPVTKVGVIGTNSFYEETKQQLPVSKQISIEEADLKTLQTDLIVGKYSYVIQETMSESEREKLIEKMTQSISQIDGKDDVNNTSSGMRVYSMMLTVFMLVSTIYMSSLIYDRTHGLRERFCLAGATKRSYAAGYFYSTALITGIQMLICLLLNHIMEPAMNLPVQKELLGLLLVFAVSNVFAVLVCSMVHSEMAANLTASGVAAVCSMLGGTFVAVEAMPKALQIISWISPMRWIGAIIE